MTVIREFVDHLVAKINTEQPQPLMCSRAELAVDGTAVMVILRTHSTLTNAYLSCLPFTYPISMVTNVSSVLWHAAPYVQNGSVVPTTSEVMRAAMVDATGNRTFGTWCDEDMFYVPEAVDPSLLSGKGVYTSEEKWSGLLYSPDLPGLDPYPSIPSFGVAHVPDMPSAELSDDIWTHLGRLLWGWNYSKLFGEDELAIIGRSLRRTVSQARTIAVFS